ncbi:MAG: glucose-1-phosphate adenylyltransferase [Planctomycetota bacterium]
MPSVTAVIMGGGRGTRLYPLTKDRSKPAVPLAGKYRLIDIAISNCINSGIRHIYVLTQFNSASLNQHVSRAYRFDLFTRGFVDILAAEQTESSGEWFQGTADAVRQSYQHLADEPADYILVLSGDHLYSMDYSQFLENHIAHNAEISVAVQAVTAEQSPELGILKTDAKGRILEFVEKPAPRMLPGLAVDTTAFGLTAEEAKRRPYLGSMGIYFFSWKSLAQILAEDKDSVDFGKEIIPKNMQRRHTQAYVFHGYWADIGTVKAFFNANLDLCTALPAFNLFDPQRPIYTNTRFLPPAKIRGGQIEDCTLSEGSIVDSAIIKRSLLGVRSRVFSGVSLEEVVMLGADFYESAEMAQSSAPRLGIGEGAVIRRAIIDKNACIGKNVRLVNVDRLTEYRDPEERFVVRDGIIVVVKNAVIPHNFIF